MKKKLLVLLVLILVAWRVSCQVDKGNLFYETFFVYENAIDERQEEFFDGFSKYSSHSKLISIQPGVKYLFVPQVAVGIELLYSYYLRTNRNETIGFYSGKSVRYSRTGYEELGLGVNVSFVQKINPKISVFTTAGVIISKQLPFYSYQKQTNFPGHYTLYLNSSLLWWFHRRLFLKLSPVKLAYTKPEKGNIIDFGFNFNQFSIGLGCKFF